MPILQLPAWSGTVESGAVHALDLDIPCKNGILGNGVEELDLKKAIEELDLWDVPSVFVCPISLEPMEDPVTLCTGQTYERSNILKWLSMGQLTCPITMQELWDRSLTPNKTLHHLIHSWFSHKYLEMKKRLSDVDGTATELLEILKNVKGQARIKALRQLQRLVSTHLSAKKLVSDRGGIGLVASFLGPFTSHSVGSSSIGILVNLTLTPESKLKLMEPDKVSLIVDLLSEGTIDTKINCTRLIESLMDCDGFRVEIVQSLSLLAALLRLVKDRRCPSGIQAGLTLLKKICRYEQSREFVVSIGAVSQLVQLLPSLSSDCWEHIVFILDALSMLPEGLTALKDCPETIPNVVKLLMRVSESCMRHAVSILWAVCKLAPEECATVAVEAGLATKLLLVIQSGYSQALKQQSAELLKLCSLNYSATIFVSNCNLTRKIQ